MNFLKIWILIIGILVKCEFGLAQGFSITIEGFRYTLVPGSNYTEGVAECQMQGGQPAVVDTDAKFNGIRNALNDMVPHLLQFYIGLTRNEGGANMNEDFTWSNGETLQDDEAKWGGGEPRFGDSDNCIIMEEDTDYEFAAKICTLDYDLICEFIEIVDIQEEICSEESIIVVHPSNFTLTSFEGYRVVIAPEQLLSYQLTSDNNFCLPTSFENYAVFTFNLTECFPIVQDDGDYLIYTYTVWAIEIESATQKILRYSDRCFNTTCIYPKEKNVTSEYVMPSIRKYTFEAETAEGEFDLNFGLYAFANCTDTEDFSGTPPTVEVSDYIYARITDDVASLGFMLQAQSCWASPYKYPYTNVTYPIIMGGCAANNAFDPSNAIEVIKNFNETILFKFKSFVWTNFTDADQKIYVHCTVTFCDMDSGEDCTDNVCPGGTGRKRRDLSQMESHVISVGPMSINVDLCEKNNGGCEELCSMVNHEKMCSCFGGKVLGEDQHSCLDIDRVETSLREGWLIEEAHLFVWLMCAASFILLLVLYIVKKRENVKI